MKKFFTIFFVLLLLLCAGVFWFFATSGRGMVVTALEKAIARKVTLGAVHPSFPAGLVLKDLRIEGLAKIPKSFITVRLRPLLDGRLEIRSLELQSPEITISLPGPAVSAASPSGVMSPAVTVVPASQKLPAAPAERSLVIDRVIVRNATVMVQAPSTGKTWVIKNVQADLRHLSPLGLSIKTDFNVEASLTDLNVPFVGHSAKASGWVNWAARDMEASVEARDEDGRLGLSAVLVSKANDCEVKGRALLSSRQSAQATAKRPKMVESVVLDLLDSSKTDIEAEFSFHTALDHFEVARVNISGNLTTGLQTEEISGNIVGSLKAAGAKLLDKDRASTVKPYKP